MTGKRTFQTAILMAMVAVGNPRSPGRSALGQAHGQRPRRGRPNQEYPVTEQNGPWMVMAGSFSGEVADQAHDLVLELRKRYKLAAYSHKVEFKLDDPNGPNGPLGPRRRQYKQLADHPELYKDGAIAQYAVLVGNYPAIHDPEARKDLQTLICSARLSQGLREAARTPDAGRLRHIQEDIKERLSPGGETKRKGPMGHAFVTTNPQLPSEYYAPKGKFDKLVLRMNRGVTSTACRTAPAGIRSRWPCLPARSW